MEISHKRKIEGNESEEKRLKNECLFIQMFPFMKSALEKHLTELEIQMLRLTNTFFLNFLKPFKKFHGGSLTKSLYRLAIESRYFKLAYWIGNKKLPGYFPYVGGITEKPIDNQETILEETQFQERIVFNIMMRNDDLRVLMQNIILNGNNNLLNLNLVKKDLNPEVNLNGLLPKDGYEETFNILLKKGYDISTICRFDVLRKVAKNGNLNFLKWLHENGCKMNASIFSDAVEGEHLKIVEWLLEIDCPKDRYSCFEAAKKGNLNLLIWLRNNNFPWDETITCIAAKKGHFELLKWAIENGCPLDPEACENAAYKNHFEIVKWLSDKCSKEKVFESAIIAGSLEMLKWLKCEGFPIPESFEVWIIIKTQMDYEKLQWLVDEKIIILDRNVCFCHVNSKRQKHADYECENIQQERYTIVVLMPSLTIEILQWMLNNGLKWNRCLKVAIAYTLNKQLIQWAILNGCKKSRIFARIAIEKGKFDLLKFLKEIGIIFNETVFKSAIIYEDFETIEWLKTIQCPYDNSIIIVAAKCGNLEILKWFKKHTDKVAKDICSYAAFYGQLETLIWLRENNFPWDEDITKESFENQNWQCFTWALKNNCPISQDILKKAIKIGFNLEKLIPNSHPILSTK